MKPLFLLLLAPVLVALSCEKTDDCKLNDPAPVQYWEQPLESDLQQSVLTAFVYGADAFFATGLNNTQLVRIRGNDGAVSYQNNWNGPEGVERYVQEGPYLYWAIFGSFYRYHLEQKTKTPIGSVGSSAIYNEGWCMPFEGLLAGIFRESSMQDRDDVIAVFDMASQKQLFRYEIQDPQVATYLGDPALGRTAAGDTVLAFVENTKDQLLIFNLSTNDTIAVNLPAAESYLHSTWNIHIRQGRIFLGLRSAVFCIDASTGAVLWQRQEGDPGKICRVFFAGDQLLFHANTKTLYALDPATGAERWKNEEAGFSTADYAQKDDILYYTTWDLSDGNRRILIGIDVLTGCKKVQLDNLFSVYSGLAGITTDGYLILSNAQSFAGYK